MKIALIGYGKMGQTIERIAQERGHTIVAKLNDPPTLENIHSPDVAIEFTQPDSAFNNLSFCIENNIPVVSGTTGWLEKKPIIENMVVENNGAFLYGSNFSLGVNLFFELNKKLAQLMKPYPNYSIKMNEIHHTQKLDAPSGTAITLAEGIIENSHYTQWELDKATKEDSIPITAERIDNVPGTHTISYVSKEDTLSIEHTAHSRDGFALGAVIAAEFLVDKKGIYTMKDVLQLS